MKLLGVELSKAGLKFLSAKAVHRSNEDRSIDEIVVLTEEDAQKIEEWANEKGYAVLVRVASEEEAREIVCQEMNL